MKDIIQSLEISYFLSELPAEIAQQLFNKLSLSGKTLIVSCVNAEEAAVLRRCVNPAIARVVKRSRGKYKMKEVRYQWRGGKSTIPLILPRGQGQPAL